MSLDVEILTGVAAAIAALLAMCIGLWFRRNWSRTPYLLPRKPAWAPDGTNQRDRLDGPLLRPTEAFYSGSVSAEPTIELPVVSKALAERPGAALQIPVPRQEIAPSLAWLRGLRGVAGSYLLARPVNRIGRSSTGDVVLNGDTVSRHQCTIHYDGISWMLAPEPSRNGTFVNSEQVPPDRFVRLRSGDKVRIGAKIELEVFIPAPVGRPDRLRLRVAAVTATGGRPSNEDAYFADERLVAVADGVGGRPAGDVAARLAVSGIAQAESAEQLVRTLSAVNAKIRELAAADPHKSGMASTLDAAILELDGLEYWMRGVHIGDGIAMMQINDHVRTLTAPHTLAAELVAAGQLSAPEGRAYPQGGQLMRAVGLDESANPDEWQQHAKPGQRYVLASDGLGQILGGSAVRRALVEFRDQPPDICAERLVELAVRDRDADNVTVVVADVVADD